MQFETMEDANGRPIENVRVLDLGNNKLYLKYTDPYGFVTINFDKGQVPQHLRGQYTSMDAAKIAALNYLENKKREVKT